MTAWLRMLDQIEISLLDCHFRWLHPHLKFLILPGEKWPPHRRFGHLARCFGSINLLYALIIGDPISTDVGNVRPSQTGAWLHWAPGFFVSTTSFSFNICIYSNLLRSRTWASSLCLAANSVSPTKSMAQAFAVFSCSMVRTARSNYFQLLPLYNYTENDHPSLTPRSAGHLSCHPRRHSKLRVLPSRLAIGPPAKTTRTPAASHDHPSPLREQMPRHSATS